MTNGEQKLLWHGVAAGMITGLVAGLLLALFILAKPEMFAVLTR
jgi:tetrahydromethanopterin S-methyltransferase subunit F